MRAISSIRARIAASFLVILVLLCMVVAGSLLAGRTVSDSLARYDAAQHAAWHIAEVAASASTLQLGVTRYSGSELATDRAAAAAALAALQDALANVPAEVKGSLADAILEADSLAPVLDRLVAAIIARRDAGAALEAATVDLTTDFNAIQQTAVRLGVEDTHSAVLRGQSATQRASLFAAHFEVSASPASLAGAKGEIAHLSAALADAGQSFAGSPRLQRQMAAAMATAETLSQAIDGLEMQTLRRLDAGTQLDGALVRIKAVLDAQQARLDGIGNAAEAMLRLTLRQGAAAILAIAACAVALSLACIAVIIRSCVRPLAALVSSVLGVASGELAVAVAHTARTDEIGMMARAVVTLRDGASRARMAEVEAKSTAQAVAAERHHTALAQAEATEAALGGVARTVGRTADRLLRAANGLSGITGRTTGRAEEVAAESQRSRVRAESAAGAVGQLMVSVAAMARQVADAAHLTNGMARDAGRTEATVRSLADAASGVQQATQLIADVARRTRLLALNAAIEAARAGPAGHGFQVVAAEVKALATQTAAATERIAAQMKAMKAATDEAITTINAIRTAADSVAQTTAHVVATVAGQHVAMQGFEDAAAQAALAANGVAVAMQAVLDDASAAAQAVDGLRAMAAEVATQGGVLEGELEKVVGELRAA